MSTSEFDLASSFEALSQALGARYSLERVIGRGGTSLVYLARDLKTDRPVAVKFLRSEVAAGLGAARFLREIRYASRLDHPRIVPILDSGDANSLLYLVMPYVDGESLRELMDRERKLTLKEALRLTLQVADALGFAHSRNIVHRDVKPENILLLHGDALVVDFGIAKALSSTGNVAITGESVSVEGVFIGTPLYMAPEQVFSDLPVDERADIYGLATVLYEMLEGRPPLEGLTNMAILSKKSARPAPPPESVLEPLPSHVEKALMKALERDRNNRFSSVVEFTTALTAPR